LHAKVDLVKVAYEYQYLYVFMKPGWRRGKDERMYKFIKWWNKFKNMVTNKI
jgi:hypothetical protein